MDFWRTQLVQSFPKHAKVPVLLRESPWFTNVAVWTQWNLFQLGRGQKTQLLSKYPWQMGVELSKIVIFATAVWQHQSDTGREGVNIAATLSNIFKKFVEVFVTAIMTQTKQQKITNRRGLLENQRREANKGWIDASNQCYCAATRVPFEERSHRSSRSEVDKCRFQRFGVGNRSADGWFNWFVANAGWGGEGLVD